MESMQGDIAILLANRTYLYRLLQSFLGNEPALKAIEILNNDHTKTSLSLLSIEKSLDLLRDFAEQLEMNKEEVIERACSEYTRLFIGPAKLPAPPWESVYVMKERLIFQETTLKVRQCYLNYNFLPVHYRSEADDHIALELDFMHNLSSLVEISFQERNMSRAREILKDQKDFLEEHLLVWVPQFISDLEAATSHPLYRGLADMLKEFLQVDSKVINEILDTLP
ncbi:molecular chaperone TorD family protein [Desulfosporosinus sp. PR]|uniref:TorD/DmsD family molecular chaperone n=1 Tax=Candidatus Desulfosporosinus nitrosoreducens TaxID=3401928 RepID=UPI0027F3C8CB|nr:molecular chaperone TorD family protein [Desulfosporosinus sp. PR]MDQ7092083.1 molecular chaperone TorD family protein [Desulfosporosinus sp. PR]